MRKATNRENVNRFEVQLRVGSKIESEIIAELDANAGVYGAKRELLMAWMSSGFHQLQQRIDQVGAGKDGVSAMASVITDPYLVAATNYYLWAAKNGQTSSAPEVVPIAAEVAQEISQPTLQQAPEPLIDIESSDNASSKEDQRQVDRAVTAETVTATKKPNPWGSFKGIAGTQSNDTNDN